MSPRPATLTDTEILMRGTRAVRAVSTNGPRMSLAQIAEEMGLTAARRSQAHGSCNAPSARRGAGPPPAAERTFAT